MTKQSGSRHSRAKLAHSEQKFIFAHRFSTGSARLIDIFSTASSAGCDQVFALDILE